MGHQSIIGNYNNSTAVLDELRDLSGDVRPHWQSFITALEQMGHRELLQNQRELVRLVRMNGVTYNVHGAADGAQRPWKLDILPLIISAADWTVIEQGVQQRADLYELILRDIYGEQRIIREGIVPMELIHGHAGFVRQMCGLSVPNGRRLVSCAIDVARGPDERMWVIGNRLQSPSGMGYALENRTVMARVLGDLIRDNNVRRLANFFTEYQAALDHLAPKQQEGMTAFLTPGPYNESYFEHAYMAAYLGHELVQGNDLQVRDGVVCLKTLQGLQPINVIVRRVNDLYCDPLELRDDSYIGVAGLMEVARRGNVGLSNSIGVGILENSGLIPFFPALSKFFLDQELLLPSAATWWCGQEKERDYVLEHLDELLIKRTDRSAFAPTIRPSMLSAADKETLRAEIIATPNQFVGQEWVAYSTVPSLLDERLTPQPMFLRTFMVAGTKDGDRYNVMPGGLTRCVDDGNLLHDSPNMGHISKDTWVIGDDRLPFVSLWSQPDRIETTYRQSFHLSSRAAENLFWVGRYAERVEATARLLRTILSHIASEETGDATSDVTLQETLMGALLKMTGMVHHHQEGEDEKDVPPPPTLFEIALDEERIGSLITNLKAMNRSAFNVRDFWTADSWGMIHRTEEIWDNLSGLPTDKIRSSVLETEFSHLLMSLTTFAGQNAEIMTRTDGWFLLDGGRRIERMLQTIDLLRSTLETTTQSADPIILESILRTTESIITYRRRYRSWLHVSSVLDLLILEEANPRSLLYQANRLHSHINQLPDGSLSHRLRREQHIALDLVTRIKLIDIAQLTRTGKDGVHYNLIEYLDTLKTLLWGVANALSQHYFSHTQIQRPLVVLAENEVGNEIENKNNEGDQAE